jgi:tetratricopeptide (TPR) repeat protein
MGSARLSNLLDWLRLQTGGRRWRWRGIGPKQTWQEEVKRRNRLGGVNAAAAAGQQQERRKGGQPQKIPMYFQRITSINPLGMFSTINSSRLCSVSIFRRLLSRARHGLAMRRRHLSLPLLAVVGATAFNVLAGSDASPTNGLTSAGDPASRAQKTYLTARARHESEPRNTDAAWQFARACFDVAESATNNTERAQVAEQGIAACRELTARATNSAPAHYYLAMNLGKLADTQRNLAALKIVKEMEREFLAVRDLDEKFDYAGPDRGLGLLYLQAPAIISIGSRGKARQHLQRAVDLAPDYPENRLNLLEACLKWSDRAGAQRELKSLETLWPRAQTNFAGEVWAASWADWNARLETARKKIAEPPKHLESPREKG